VNPQPGGRGVSGLGRGVIVVSARGHARISDE
jgi:hypothetical protein